MKKYILLLILILISGCVQQDFTYSLKYCSKEVKSPNPDQVSYIQEGNTLNFTQILNIYCSNENKLRSSYNKKGKYIEINEILYVKEAVKCICPMEIRGEIKNLDPGTYNIKFKLENTYTDNIKLIHENDVQVI